MTIEVKIFGQLLLLLTERHQYTGMKYPVLVQGVVNLLRLNPEEVGLITIEGVQREMEDLIELGYRLRFFPPIFGV
jgi:hypothetical protein